MNLDLFVLALTIDTLLIFLVILVVGIVLQHKIESITNTVKNREVVKMINSNDIIVRDRKCNRVGHLAHISEMGNKDVIIIDLEE